MTESSSYSHEALSKMRRFSGLSQRDLSKILKKDYCLPRTQSDISRFEREGNDPRLQEVLSQYFRSRGHDADPTGATLYIPPKSELNGKNASVPGT